MSKLLWVLGVVLAALGVALGLMSIMSPGKMQIYGLTPETAAILLVGGILCFGLGGVISALGTTVLRRSTGEAEPKTSVVELTDEAPLVMPARIPGFGRKNIEAAGAAAVATVATVAAATETPRSSVADTIAALEQAKTDIKTALGGVENMTSHVDESEPTPISAGKATIAPAVVPDETTAESETELYVVEEKIIRGRPSRILSDDTVEAETDEGWMRFENLEHLNEYLDSLEETEA
jgi:hypothetical protein